MKAGAAFLPIFLLLPLFAGCTSPPPIAEITIGAPKIGDRVVYEGSDGGTVVVTVLGDAVRADGGQTLHDVLVLRYDVRRKAPPSHSWTIEEAVDKTNGIHVRHDALDVLRNEMVESKPQDEVYFLPYGLVGGLGLAPFWGGSLQAGEHVVGAAGGSRLKATPTAEIDGRACMALSAVDRQLSVAGWWMPITAALGPNTVCAGDFLPTIWTSDLGYRERDDRVVYKAVRKERAETSWMRVDSLTPLDVARESTSGPLALLVERPTITDFDSTTAHKKALALDPEYEAFLRSSGTNLVDARFTSGAEDGGTLAGERRYTSTWTLTLAQPDGQGYSVTIAKTRHVPLLDSNYTTYSVDEAGPVEWDDPPPAEAFNGTAGAFVYDLGRALFGEAPAVASHRTTVRKAVMTSDREALEDSFRISIFIHPDDAETCTTGTCVMAPLILDGDSATGWLTYARLPPDSRPRI